jgi:hypothetical protein
MIAQQGQGGFGGGPQVSDDDCKKVDDVLKAHPKEKKQLDDLRAKLQALRPAGFGGGNNGGNGGGFNAGGGNRNRSRGDSAQGGANGGQRRRGGAGGAGGADSSRGGRGGAGGGFRGSPEMQAINEQIRAIYTTLNLDARTAGACARRQGGNVNAGAGATRSANAGNRAPGAQGSALTPSPELNGRPQRQRAGLVYVSDSSKTVFHPRIVQLGEGNLDFTEVISGLKEGERVVMLSALALQSQRQQMQDRFRQNASPLGGATGGRGGRGR